MQIPTSAEMTQLMADVRADGGMTTAREFAENGLPEGRVALLSSHAGEERIGSINPETWWAHCPEANYGQGQSFSLHPNAPLLVTTEEQWAREIEAREGRALAARIEAENNAPWMLGGF